MRLAVLAALVALVAAQAWTAAHVELTFDEAYYALWARWPQPGYFDHPPLVAWAIALSTRLFGDGEFAVRAPFWLMGAALPPLVYAVARRLYDEDTALRAALFLLAAPLMAGAPLATPDTPLVFFWALALLGLAEVWRGRGSAWVLVGLATGAAGLAKMTAGFLALGIALALAATPALRPQWRRPGPYLAAGLALAVLSPFLLWNATHGYATFLKQGGRVAAGAWAPRYLAEFVGAQLLLFNPLTAVAVALAAARRRAAPSEPSILLLATVAPALAYFAIHALHDRVQGNWPAPLYPALAMLAARATRGWSFPAPAAAALGLAAILGVYVHLATAWPNLGPDDPARRVGGWRELSAQVFDEARAGSARFVLADGYAATSLLTYYGPGAPPLAELGEPERWTFRPSVPLHGPGLAVVPPDFPIARLYPGARLVKTLQRRVGGVALESYALFAIEGGSCGGC